jgi:hypothetical protein
MFAFPTDVVVGRSAANQWCGISSMISIPIVGTSLANPTCTVTVDVLQGNDIGYFQSNSLYTGGEITVSNTCYDAYGQFVYSDAGKNNPYDWLMHILTHEIGHLLSLGHPRESNINCLDFCVMYDQDSLNSNLDPDAQRTHYVTAHDRRALVKK